MKFEKENFGIKIIETITSGLYDGNPNCLREYVQNSIDARATRIDVLLRNGGNDLEIKDDGEGMNKTALERALEVGVSYKTQDEIGWRGIGFWSGVPASLRIVVVTKKKNEKPLRIQIDSQKLRDEMYGNRPILDVLTEATGEVEELELGASDNKDTHFTLIRLESILDTQRGIFNEEEIRRYLSRTVPAPFDEKRFPHGREVNRILKSKGIKIPEVRIDFQGKRIFRPPTTGEFIDAVIEKDFEVGGKLVATGWFLTTRQNRVLRQPNSGVFFRKKGFTIGDESLFRRQSDKTYSQWQYGEIHILSNEITENAARNSFESNARFTKPLLDQIRDFIPDLQMLNRYASTKMAPSELARARGALARGDVATAQDNIRRLRSKLTRKPEPTFPDDDPSLKVMKRAIDGISKRHERSASILDKKINNAQQGRKTDVELAREHLESVKASMPMAIRRELLKHARRDGTIEPSVNLTDILANVIRKKANLSDNEMHILTKKAFDWVSVQGAKDSEGPILTVVGPFDPKSGTEEDGRLEARNRRFGVMIYAIHDLLVNPAKHSKGKASFAWFEKPSLAERLQLTAWIYSMIAFASRLIESSQKFTPKRGSQN